MKYKGVSGFAIRNPRYPIKRFLRQYPNGIQNPAIAVLWYTFGRGNKGLQAFEEKFCDKRRLYEVHVSNGPGRRAGKLYKGDFLWKLDRHELNSKLEEKNKRVLKKIESAALDIEEKLEWNMPYGAKHGYKLIICPELEDNLTNKAYKVFARTIKNTLTSNATIVRNPCTGGEKARLLERHNPNAWPCYLWNNDGTTIRVDDIDHYSTSMSKATAKSYWDDHHKSNTRLLWYASQQGLQNSGHGMGGAPPPRERKFVVTNEAIKFSREVLG